MTAHYFYTIVQEFIFRLILQYRIKKGHRDMLKRILLICMLVYMSSMMSGCVFVVMAARAAMSNSAEA